MTRIDSRAAHLARAIVTGTLVLSAHLGRPLFAEEPPPLAQSPLTAEQAQNIQRQWAQHLGKEVELINSIGMKLVLIPPGEFTMGRTQEQLDQWLQRVDKNSRGGLITWSLLMMPAHRVRITKPFYMGATEVTVAQYRQFCEETGYKTEAERGLEGGVPYQGKRPLATWRKPRITLEKGYQQQDDEPVLHLTWNDCVAFCKWLSNKEGVEYDLPTEAQWEYACRAGTTTPWSFGNFEDLPRVAHQYAWWSEGPQGPHDKPRSVGKGKPNAFGLYDMHGNVWEYVADWWHEMYYKESPLNDPTGPQVQHERGDLRRIIRGGSYDWDSSGGDAAYRMRITQHSSQHPHQGFRVVLRIPGVQGVPPAVDPDEERRKQRRDPGADSPEVLAALMAASLPHDLPKELVIDLGGAEMEFVLIPAGSFLMGSTKGPKDERPVHRVVISRPFYMAKFPVTQAQWGAVMGKQGRLKELEDLWQNNPDTIGPKKMMVGLTWEDCQQFIEKLRAKVPDYAFALPTEAQWEYACRAGSDSEFSFGDDPSLLGEYAWYEGNMIWPGKHGNTNRAAYPSVGEKKPNRWGLYDMHGGVWEWCADWYDPDYYLTSPLVDPQGPKTGRFKVVRGGSWFRHGQYARSAYRRFFHPEQVDYVTAYIQDFGCRVVINLERDHAVAKAERNINYTQLARNLVRHPHNPVLRMGEKGAWNDQTLGCFTVLDTGKQFFLYTEGARYGKHKSIGLATSADGIHWTWFEKNPLFPGSMPNAVKVGDTFRLYYSGGHAGLNGLQMRTSEDGYHWSEPKPVFDDMVDPKVVRAADNTFYLYYCDGGKVTKDGKQVWEFKNYMATSEDGIHWKKIPGPVLPLGPKGSWDESSHAGPCVLKLDDGFHMFYLGSGSYRGGKTAWRVGHATSPDGLKWTKSGNEPVLDIGRPGDWDGGTIMSISVIFRDGKFHFWYAADPGPHDEETKMSIQIGYGTSK